MRTVRERARNRVRRLPRTHVFHDAAGGRANPVGTHAKPRTKASPHARFRHTTARFPELRGSACEKTACEGFPASVCTKASPQKGFPAPVRFRGATGGWHEPRGSVCTTAHQGFPARRFPQRCGRVHANRAGSRVKTLAKASLCAVSVALRPGSLEPHGSSSRAVSHTLRTCL